MGPNLKQLFDAAVVSNRVEYILRHAPPQPVYMRDWISTETQSAVEPVTIAFDPAAKVAELQAAIERVIRGKSETVKFVLIALLAKGHLLIEDVPGIGKTTLANALARSLELSFQRIQFTSDLLPSDVIGLSVFNQRTDRLLSSAKRRI